MKKIIGFTLIILAFNSINAQQVKQELAKPEIGKSAELSNAFIKKTLAAYEYTPVILEFWTEVEKTLVEKEYGKLIKIADKQLNVYGESSPEGQEALLAQAISFYHQNFIYAAFRQLLMISKNQIGTSVGSYALSFLSEIIKAHDYDKHALFEFIDNQESENLPPEIQNFISYFKSIVLLKYGYNEWAKKHLLLIKQNSHWDVYRKYMSSLALVGKGKVDIALTKLNELSAIENLHPKLKNKIELQIARLLFEKGEFAKAHSAYRKIEGLGVREKGRVLLERSWALYYQKKYSQALGVLHSLKSPFFKTSIRPEPYILQMLILKELCHYKAVIDSAKEFRMRFRKTIKNIRARRDLKRDPALFGMAVMNLDVQMTANLISKIREERKEIRKKDWGDYSFYSPLMKAYKLKNAQLQMQVDYKLDGKIREAALELLDSANQVHFLEYSASLDAVKVTSGGSASRFKHEAVTKYNFDKLFWPIEEEYWFDELEDYTVNISSQCLKETDVKQLKLEEDFN